MTTDIRPLAYLVFGAGFGVFLFFNGFGLRKRKQLIESIPTSKVRSLAMGLSEIQGKALPVSSLLTSPFSEASCVYYRYCVRERRGSGKNRHWVTIAEYESPDCFYVEDETGKVMVNPKGAELHLNVDRTYSTGTFVSSEMNAQFQNGLMRIGVDPTGFFGFSRPLQCREIFIQPDDLIYVMGEAMNNPFISASAVGADNILVGKGASEFFCISDESEKSLLLSFMLKMYAYLYGGPALTLACLFLILMLYFNGGTFQLAIS